MNILLITYNWPPRNTIGTHRPLSWARYWSQEGAAVTVLTSRKTWFDSPLDLVVPDLPGVIVHEIPFLGLPGRAAGIRGPKRSRESGLRRLKERIAAGTGWRIDLRAWWRRPAVRAGLKLARSRRFDCIVSTHGPRVCHLVAHRIARECSRAAWVADYRDLWIGNPLAPLRGARLRRESRLEMRTVGQRADLVTTVSEGLAASLRNRLGRPVEVIRNGHDGVGSHPTSSEPGSRWEPPGLRLVHTGSLYGGTRDPSPLFRATRAFARAAAGAARPRIEFYGARCEGLETLISRCGAGDFVTRHGHVSHAEALRHQREADALVLLESGLPSHEGILTGKVFEYLASGRPVLGIGPRAGSELDRLLRDCGVGMAVGTDESAIERMLNDIAAGPRPSWFHPDANAIAALSREAQARTMLGRIQEVIRCRTTA